MTRTAPDQLIERLNAAIAADSRIQIWVRNRRNYLEIVAGRPKHFTPPELPLGIVVEHGGPDGRRHVSTFTVDAIESFEILTESIAPTTGAVRRRYR